ncbi:MAG: hypothetical protein HY816_09470 [Candidatus Wallbacteria bacterium]|nr:hypothetical protein [Candidatus Wallbacteria bacterium]
MDAAQLRRQKRLQQKLAQAKWIVYFGIIALIGFYLYWRSERVETARIVSDEFLSRIGKREIDVIPKRLFTTGLQEDLPERKFQRQMALLARKLGSLQGFQLIERELSWDNSNVRLVYQAKFERSGARAIFEIVVDPRGYWKIDTYFFWADKWKRL